MTQASPNHEQHGAVAIQGDALQRQLEQGWRPLPGKTLLALALGGLRVRMMRSVVTMISVVLAIAFLTYTGLSNALSYNLAVAARPEVVPVAAIDLTRVQELQKLLRGAAVNIDKTLAGNPMDTWLIAMAMLTCAVGIANAMLMSVTERFREIGTMKCLGAQDNLVVKLFLLESAFLGVVGAAIGIVVGVLVAVLAAYAQFGRYGGEYFPVRQGVGVVLMSVLGGVALSVLGAVYPAFMASRMRPVDALRVDE